MQEAGGLAHNAIATVGLLQALDDILSAIGAPVIDDDDLEVHTAAVAETVIRCTEKI